MRRTRRVAKVARKAGAGQAQTAWSGFRSGTAASGNPQKTLLGQPRQARQGDSDPPYMREANQCACEPEPELVNHTNNSISHVSFSCEADQADQADQAKETAAFCDRAQADQSLPRLTEVPPWTRWSRVRRLAQGRAIHSAWRARRVDRPAGRGHRGRGPRR